MSIFEARIKTIHDKLSQIMIYDKYRIMRELDSINPKKLHSRKYNENLSKIIESLEKRVAKSISKAESRKKNIPPLYYPENLPITTKRNEIISAIKNSPVIVIEGDTGSGKSTQLPKMCLEAGRGITGIIGCTQPRRIAAISVASRIAEELGKEVGQDVGYKIRFNDHTQKGSYIKVLTDGMLLSEAHGNNLLSEYDTVIIDEAHERSLNIDFLLGLLKKLTEKRHDLKIIIASATIDTEKFSKAFDNAPVISVKGRLFPVDVEYFPPKENEEEHDDCLVSTVVRAVDNLRGAGRIGDTLIFMPTEAHILETAESLKGRKFSDETIIPLYARLPAEQQKKIFSSIDGHKIIVATNVAETSITIPGIQYVIDSGLVREARYLPRSQTTSMPIVPVSIASAEQRKGRCGRISKGVCIRLYSQEDLIKRPHYTTPEILRTNLAEVILRMISLKLGHIENFPFIDPPHPRSIKDGYDILIELGAIRKKGEKESLTAKGKTMAKLPLDPRIAAMLIEGKKEGCIEEAAIVAAAMSIQNPLERPAEKAAQADQAHSLFKDKHSDFAALLKIWRKYHETLKENKSNNVMKKFCREHFISFPRMREWRDIYWQIRTILNEEGFSLKSTSVDTNTALHKSILSGFLSHIAKHKEKNFYQASKGREVMIFPGSNLFSKGAEWIVALEFVKTSRLFARTAGEINKEWLEPIAGDLCVKSYSSPYWSKKLGTVMAYEKVTLFGLPIVENRSIYFSSIDPEEASRIFIAEALMEGNIRERFSFIDKNKGIIDSISLMENKLRRRYVSESQEILEHFYRKKLNGISDVRSLARLIKDSGGDKFLEISENDLLIEKPDEKDLKNLFPEKISIDGTRLSCDYHYSPGSDNDGVTVKIPLGVSAHIDDWKLDWLVPGLLREKIAYMIKGLSKQYRKQLIPINTTVDIIMTEMPKGKCSLPAALSEFIYKKFSIDIPASTWKTSSLPPHLLIRLSVIDGRNREIISGRDPGLLKIDNIQPDYQHTDKSWKNAVDKWEKSSIDKWDFDVLPEKIIIAPGKIAYPALFSHDHDNVAIRLFQTSIEADKSHPLGVKALLKKYLARELRQLKTLIASNSEIKQSSLPGKNAAALAEAVIDYICHKHMCICPRRKEDFEEAAARIKKDIHEESRVLLLRVIEILKNYKETYFFIIETEKKHKKNLVVLELCQDMLRILNEYVPENFLEKTSDLILPHLPRYIRAIRIRLERAVNDISKDQAKSILIVPFEKQLHKIRETVSDHASEGKKELIVRFIWALEEFKISVFAPEIKTSIPVSAKRLEILIAEIYRML